MSQVCVRVVCDDVYVQGDFKSVHIWSGFCYELSLPVRDHCLSLKPMSELESKCIALSICKLGNMSATYHALQCRVIDVVKKISRACEVWPTRCLKLDDLDGDADSRQLGLNCNDHLTRSLSPLCLEGAIDDWRQWLFDLAL